VGIQLFDLHWGTVKQPSQGLKTIECIRLMKEEILSALSKDLLAYEGKRRPPKKYLDLVRANCGRFCLALSYTPL
jgi:hypothetical protein